MRTFPGGRGGCVLAGDSKGRFTRGATSMVASVFIAKLLGILFVVPLQNLIGTYALGLYQLVYPLYNIMLTLTTAGFPLALSKTISHFAARGEYRKATATYSIVGRTLALSGVVGFFIMWFAGPLFLAGTAAGPASVRLAVPAVRALAPALLILPLMSAQRGYLQGNLRLEPSGSSQVLEQFVRVGVVLLGLIVAVRLGAGPSTTAAIATFGATAGAVAAFVFLLHAVRRLRRELARKSRYAPVPQLRPGYVLPQLFIYSLPIALGTLVLPISQSIDAWTVTRELRSAGTSAVAAIALYAIYSGEALRLMQVPLSFATAIGASVMPAVTEAVTLHDSALAHRRLLAALRMTAFVTLPAAVSLAALARPIDIALFQQPNGVQVIAIAAIISVFSALELVSTYILQGYNTFYRPVWHMAAGAAVKLGGNLLFIPLVGINGAALGSVCGYAFSSWLNMLSLRRIARTQVTFLTAAWRPLAAAVTAGLIMYMINRLYVIVSLNRHAPDSRSLALLCILVAGAVGAPLYLGAALWIRAVTREELAALPVLGRLARRAQKPV